MNQLEVLMKELEETISKQEQINPSVSQASVGWHIEHTLLTMNVIIDALKNSNQSEYRWKFNFTRLLVLTMKKIPRGRAQSPKIVRPVIDFNQETLQQHLALSKHKIKDLDVLQPNHHFKHPFFGNLNLKPTIRFLQIHTQHHLHIIKDIIGKPGTTNQQ